MKRFLKWAAIAVVAGILALPVYYQFTTATNDGPWKPIYENRASSKIVGDAVEVSNFRRARYDETGAPLTISWENRSLDLSQLKDVWLGISVFAEPGLAHTFLSFDFGDGDPVVISVEARQRPDQSYGVVAGMLDSFPLIYVIADERDIIGVRTHMRRDQVFFQPLTFRPETAVVIFRNMLARTNGFIDRPEFYNTLTTNCTNSLIRDVDFPAWRRYLDWRVLLPGYSDRVAYEFDILDRSYLLEDLRAIARLDPATFELEGADMSADIRKNYYARRAKLPAAPPLP